MYPFITKPCQECGVPVKDQDDPTYTGKWQCYYCHCILTGRDVKTVLNTFSEAFITGYLVHLPESPDAKPS